MIKVFLAEDECLVREGLRDNIPWNRYGFEFAGEATDGEMALPLIRKTKPDLLITDIKMPFMDGLELSRLVRREFPDIRIIIISGYDDFEYARTAIKLQVDRYLLKPITKTAMIEALEEIKDKIDKDREQKDFMHRFQTELQEYEQFSRRSFFEQLIGGTLSVSEIYDKAEELEIKLDASAYNIVELMLQPQGLGGDRGQSTDDLNDRLMEFFADDSRYILFRWNLMSFAVIIKGEPSSIETETRECIDGIRRICESNVGQEGESVAGWYVAPGTPVERVSSLPQCFQAATAAMSYRHLLPDTHVLDAAAIEPARMRAPIEKINNLDVGSVDPMVIRNFLQTGLADEIENFTDSYIANLGSAVDSLMFRQYILLSTRINAAIMVRSFGQSEEEFTQALPDISSDVPVEGVRDYIMSVLTVAMELRDIQSRDIYRTMLKNAMEFIDEHFADEDISLKMVAKNVNVSANYFSAVFSQEKGRTFVEYLTDKRMEKAKQLLRTSNMRTSEIAFEVGYKDPGYFSFIFRKTEGCTPRDYRAGKK